MASFNIIAEGDGGHLSMAPSPAGGLQVVRAVLQSLHVRALIPSRAERAAAATPDHVRLVAELVRLIADQGADPYLLIGVLLRAGPYRAQRAGWLRDRLSLDCRERFYLQ
jgi:hypothetical protein